ncbi:hypothetical protein [uncultured Aquimarina sp.]|uniref:hypothetical protein n=1 Tax=uncultured Aquimarina sp. TaxID=575652 RepID=UPI0026040E7C|nr:hypothetical protein [uncultured Aquimarina sp.]
MDNEKDIGQFFKKELGDFTESPNATIWKNLEAELNKSDKRNYAYRLRFVAIAAIFIFSATSIIILYDNTSNSIKQDQLIILENLENDCFETTFKEITNIDKSKEINIESYPNDDTQKQRIITTKNTTDEKNFRKQNIDNKAKTSKTSINLNNNWKAGSNSRENTSAKNGVDNTNHLYKNSDNNDFKNSRNTLGKTDKNKVGNSKPLHIEPFEKSKSIVNNRKTENKTSEQLLKHNDSTKTEVVDKKLPKDTLIYLTPKPVRKKMIQQFNIAAHIIPTFTFPGDGSLLSNRLENNNEVSAISLGYGIVLTADLNDRLSLRTGYNKTKVKTNINNIVSDTISSVLLDSNIIVPNTITQTITNQETVDLTQKIKYHELSAELSYKIINKRFDWSIIGGASFLILQKNEVSLLTSTTNFDLGRSNKLAPLTTSLNFGSNLRYRLFKKVYFNIEPLIKYQLKNASKNQQSYRPLYFTIQSGVSIDF